MNESKKSFSVIVTAYNVDKYIEYAVDSLLISRGTENNQILIIDDSSTDLTWKKIQRYSKIPNVKLYKISHGGLGAARNFGMEKAEGEYIAFLDGDDFVQRDYFPKLNSLINKEGNEIDLIVFSWQFSDENNEVFGELHADGSFIGMDRMAWNKVYNTKTISNQKFPVNVLYEDVGFTSIAYLKSQNIVFESSGLYAYRQRKGSITKAQQISAVHLDVLVGLNELKQYVIKNDVLNIKDVNKVTNSLIIAHIRRILDNGRLSLEDKLVIRRLQSFMYSVNKRLFYPFTGQKVIVIRNNFIILLLKMKLYWLAKSILLLR